MKKKLMIASVIVIIIGLFIFMAGFLLGGLENFQWWFNK